HPGGDASDVGVAERENVLAGMIAISFDELERRVTTVSAKDLSQERFAVCDDGDVQHTPRHHFVPLPRCRVDAGRHDHIAAACAVTAVTADVPDVAITEVPLPREDLLVADEPDVRQA